MKNECTGIRKKKEREMQKKCEIFTKAIASATQVKRRPLSDRGEESTVKRDSKKIKKGKMITGKRMKK